MKRPWFGPKRYGIGLSPRGVSGWIATSVFALGALVFARLMARGHAPHWTILLGLGLATAAFLALAFAKSDDRSWRRRRDPRDE